MLLERVLRRDNMTKAFKRVTTNKGSAGVDGMETSSLRSYLHSGWSFIKSDLLDGSYRPQAVLRVSIPKPGGGMRKLGIPTVIDRLIQQALAQELSHLYDSTFSSYSYGFRPGRNAHQALVQGQKFLNSGKRYVVDLDLEKFFDRVNHDLLLHLLSRRISDKRVLRLIGLYLRSGVMEGGLVSPNREGTPQGGPLSPILSNILLDELDKELTSRGHSYVRYADDCSIFVRSRKAGLRVLSSISTWLSSKLGLRVNKSKSGVRSVVDYKLLGFSYYHSKGRVRLRVSTVSYSRLKARIRWFTRRNWPIPMFERLSRLSEYLRGWLHYYKLADCKKALEGIDSWMRARIRMRLWKEWKLPSTRIRNLIKLGIGKGQAYEWGNSRRGYWRVAHSPILHRSLSVDVLLRMGYYSLSAEYSRLHVT